ncbi:hypothetical protein FQV24_0000412, partial [Spheniscus mendiculus]
KKKDFVNITHSCIGEHHCLLLISQRLKWRPDQLFHSYTSTCRRVVSVCIHVFF